MLVVERGEDTVAAAHIAAAGEVLDALAKTSAAHTRRELQAAANAFERASRSHIRAVRGRDRALRQAARDLVRVRGGPALGCGEDGAVTALAIDMLFFLVTAAVHWHARKGHAQQTAAARQAAEHLRSAYRAAAPAPLSALRQRGRGLPQPQRHHHAAQLRQALPELAEKILSEPGRYALAATLADAQRAGHDPTALLARTARRRELGTAESVSDVLVWRLRRTANLPLDTPAPETNSTLNSPPAPWRSGPGPARTAPTTPRRSQADRSAGPPP